MTFVPKIIHLINSASKKLNRKPHVRITNTSFILSDNFLYSKSLLCYMLNYFGVKLGIVVSKTNVNLTT